MMCPHFIYNVTNPVDIKHENDNSSQWPYRDEALIHIQTGIKLSQDDFSYTKNGLVIFCIDKIRDKMKSDFKNEHGGIEGMDTFGTGLVVISHLCLGVSSLCLVLTLTTYCLFPVLQTLPGKSTMSMVTTLLLALTLFNIGGFVQESSVECQIIGVATHFFLLSTFAWMLLCSAHMYIIFNNIMEHPVATQDDSTRKFKSYLTLSLAIPALIVAATVVANYSLTDSTSSTYDDDQTNITMKDPEEIEPALNRCHLTSKTRTGYGHGICYLSNKLSLLVAGVLPIAAVCAANLVIFILTVLAFRRLSTQEKAARREARGHLLIYLKLSSLTGKPHDTSSSLLSQASLMTPQAPYSHRLSTLIGINWLPCTAAAFVSSPVVWYFFLVMCGLQGFYVFLSFVCNKRVLALYRQRFRPQDADSGVSRRNKGGSQMNNITRTLEKYLKSHSSESNVDGLELRLHAD
ncbi:hypothetical protein EGW08_017289 [Elysia chlorotica]|uniref:G-protein coupled receptors family 2 profile 2 domain-containing protein n=1 Tax=Elysia chlorotica TaxID=188477 RepID=A0A3S1BU53_ELYCH|nr:hypothetical protein EGW08_017289 [Elysia chlorotica]